MEDHQKRNGAASAATATTAATDTVVVSKRDKRKSNIATRLNKLELTFKNDRDMFYRNSLHDLQNKLASLQQGTDEEYLTQKIQLEETRDYELTKLRLWEEYQVKRVEKEYLSDMERAQENYDRMIKLIKEKLYDKLQKQIKNLKEDKYLLNVLNSNSYNNNSNNSLNGSGSGTGTGTGGGSSDSAFVAQAVNLRLRKRDHTGLSDIDDLSDGGGGPGTRSGRETGGGNGSSASLYHHNGLGYLSLSSKRRKPYTRYSSNDEMSSSNASATPRFNKNHINNHHNSATSGHGSGYESNLSDKDYDALNTLIMEDGNFIYDSMGGGKENGNGNGVGGSGSGNGSGSSSHRVQTRGSHKQFVGPQGLKAEELNEDLALLRTAIVKKER